MISSRRRKDRRLDIAFCVTALLCALIMGTISWFFLAYTDAIAASTHDSPRLIGEMGVLAGIGSFAMFLVLPFFIACIRD